MNIIPTVPHPASCDLRTCHSDLHEDGSVTVTYEHAERRAVDVDLDPRHARLLAAQLVVVAEQVERGGDA